MRRSIPNSTNRQYGRKEDKIDGLSSREPFPPTLTTPAPCPLPTPPLPHIISSSLFPLSLLSPPSIKLCTRIQTFPSYQFLSALSRTISSTHSHNRQPSPRKFNERPPPPRPLPAARRWSPIPASPTKAEGGIAPPQHAKCSESKRDAYSTTENHRYRQTKTMTDRKTDNARHRDTHNTDGDSNTKTGTETCRKTKETV